MPTDDALQLHSHVIRICRAFFSNASVYFIIIVPLCICSNLPFQLCSIRKIHDFIMYTLLSWRRFIKSDGSSNVGRPFAHPTPSFSQSICYAWSHVYHMPMPIPRLYTHKPGSYHPAAVAATAVTTTTSTTLHTLFRQQHSACEPLAHSSARFSRSAVRSPATWQKPEHKTQIMCIYTCTVCIKVCLAL